jgi:peptide/nickel transport system ATP-binding protein
MTSAPLLSIRDLTVEFSSPKGPVLIVDGLSFDVHRNEVFGLVGESGSGKSVSMLAVMGLLPAGAKLGGQVLLDGRDLLTMPREELRAIRGGQISMIFQEPMTSLNPVLRIGAQIAEMIQIHQPRLPRAKVRDRVVELLALVGMPDAAQRATLYPHQFSGGMRQRAMIAMALANEPSLLIADEPTTALDVTIQAQVLQVLAEVRTRTSTSMILITHDLGLIAESADRVAVMYGGRMMEVSAATPLFDEPRHPYTVGLLRSVPRLDGADADLASIPGQPPVPANRLTGCVFHPRCALRQGRALCAEQSPPLLPIGDDRAAACHFVAEVPAWAAAPPPVAIERTATISRAHVEVLRVDALKKHFPTGGRFGFGGGSLRAVDGVTFAIQQGETLGLVGESGCGKSTLGRTILGLYPPTEGGVSLSGDNLVGIGPRTMRRLRQGMQVVFQDPYGSMDPRMTVQDVVAEPLRIHGRYTPARVAELLDQVGLDPSHAGRKPAQFSGGQRQRIAIARALALQPKLLLLDEAVSALDVSIQAQVINLLMRLQRELGLAYLFIAHDLAVVRHISHRVAVMYLGRIVEIGTRDQIFGAPQHPYTQALLSAVPVPDPARRPTRIVLRGDLPSPARPPPGCVFHTRCLKAQAICSQLEPLLQEGASQGHSAACHFPAGAMPDTGLRPSFATQETGLS